ncbi:sin3 associated polypeptide p18 (SAP18) domain-containing protein [Ditylenchus destructor]|uniref:18 kDa Sin3-associated polypeptide n=1 Tax=Ditylenchus destructor TaxID=166010 RepID=A0AAD4N8G7_9BILA|nr:sin3 associated polypeptide p18 (SAP18) domain-containing protein [Ditylenchus destructor]
MALVISQVEAPEQKGIDREKACPLLLRIFTTTGRHNQINDYLRGNVPPNELQIYTWMDCTLRELMTLIKDVNPEARRRGTEFKFAIVAPDRHTPRYNIRDIGSVIAGTRGTDDNKTLADCKFEVGDFIDVAICNPPPQSSGGRFNDRGNGPDRSGRGDGRRLGGSSGGPNRPGGGFGSTGFGRYRD